MHLSALSKIYSRNSFIVSHMPLPFSNYVSDIGSGLPSFLRTVVVRLCKSHGGVHVIGVADVPPILAGIC